MIQELPNADKCSAYLKIDFVKSESRPRKKQKVSDDQVPVKTIKFNLIAPAPVLPTLAPAPPTMISQLSSSPLPISALTNPLPTLLPPIAEFSSQISHTNKLPPPAIPPDKEIIDLDEEEPEVQAPTSIPTQSVTSTIINTVQPN